MTTDGLSAWVIGHNGTWLTALAPTRNSSSDISLLMDQLQRIHQAMVQGDLYTGSNTRLSDSDLPYVTKALEGIEELPRNIRVVNLPREEISDEFYVQQHMGAIFAQSLIGTSPWLLVPWRKIIGHHSSVTEDWLAGLAWFERDFEVQENFSSISILTLGRDFTSIGGGKHPFIEGMHLRWLLYYAFLNGFIEFIRAVQAEVETTVPMQNRALNHLRITDPTQPLSEAETIGIQNIHTFARRFAFIHAALSAFKQEGMFIHPESVWQDWARSILNLVTRHDVLGHDLRSGHRGDFVHDVVWPLEQDIIHNRPRLELDWRPSLGEFLTQLGDKPGVRTAFHALLCGQVLFTQQPLSHQYWQAKLRDYREEVIPRWQQMLAESWELCRELGWIGKFYNEEGDIIYQAPQSPFWLLGQDSTRSQLGGMINAQVADLYRTCNLFSDEAERLLFEAIFMELE